MVYLQRFVGRFFFYVLLTLELFSLLYFLLKMHGVFFTMFAILGYQPGALQLNLILSLPEIKVRSYELRAQSHETPPTPPAADASCKSRLYPD